MRTVRWLLPLLLLLFSPSVAKADVITFEGLADLEDVTDQFSNLLFMNATILTAGVSLVEDEFPPFSGSNVVFDNSGPMSINFLVPVTSVGGHFTYLTRITFTAFDASNNVLGSITSAFNNNQRLSGDLGSQPNELLSFSFVSGISRITITGDLGGASFTLDDLTVEAIPEPASLYLLVGGGLTLMTILKKRMN